jgi:RNA 2',3'-cyclic 3'-phosphodiesterase
MFKRLFVGLELPESIGEELARIDPHTKGLRWEPTANLHLTFSFLGNVDGTSEDRLREALAAVQVARFFLPVTGVGSFGGDKPSVVWAGVGKGHPHLFALHKHIQDAVLHAGLEADLKPFHPHITLGRSRGVSRAVLKPFLQRHENTEFGLWQVTGFALFSSWPGQDAATYKVEMRCELGK